MLLSFHRQHFRVLGVRFRKHLSEIVGFFHVEQRILKSWNYLSYLTSDVETREWELNCCGNMPILSWLAPLHCHDKREDDSQLPWEYCSLFSVFLSDTTPSLSFSCSTREVTPSYRKKSVPSNSCWERGWSCFITVILLGINGMETNQMTFSCDSNITAFECFPWHTGIMACFIIFLL